MQFTLDNIKKQQQDWAMHKGIKFDRNGYVWQLNDNLFEPLEKNSKNEFESAAGHELDEKMKALHSSSALVCNIFHYWRYRNVSLILRACGLSSNYKQLSFEKPLSKPSEIGGKVPFLDCELTGHELRPVGMESKFIEPYDIKRRLLKNAYSSKNIWGNLQRCEFLANSIIDGNEIFYSFDAPQLLKHILGLKTMYGENQFVLLYLWYKVHSEESKKHENEIKLFKSYVDKDVKFKTITYQKIFHFLEIYRDEHPNYIEYIRQRYFN